MVSLSSIKILTTDTVNKSAYDTTIIAEKCGKKIESIIYKTVFSLIIQKITNSSYYVYKSSFYNYNNAY